MSDVNQPIERYLHEYLDLQFSPGFAVLLQGEWGCGKTWFIKRFIEEYEKAQGPQDVKKALYLSLYSVKSTSEIEDQIFQQLHPLLCSRPMALTGKILKGILRGSVGLTTGAKLDIDISKLDLPKFLLKTDDRILIFDDLERSGMPIDEVFGYINSFVEHQEMKVILIANEDELQNIEKDVKRANYKRIKEKLIGKTFRVRLDIDSAFDSFLKDVKDERVKEFIRANRDRVIQIFNIANYKNLRQLKQSIWDFERLYSEIPEKYREVSDLMVDILCQFLCFSFEIKAGKIMPSEIKDLTSLLSVKLIQTKDENYKPTPMGEVLKKYVFLNTYDTVLPEKCWRELFDEGYTSKEDLADSLGKSRYCQDEKTPDWMKLWYFRDLEDEKFSSVLCNVKKQWDEKIFERPWEILHVSGLYLKLSELGLYEEKKGDILADCKGYINTIKGSGAWSGFKGDDFRFSDESVGGLGYAGREMSEFKEIYSFLDEKIREAETESLPQAGKDLLSILSADVGKFRRMITLSSSKDQIYFSIPIFKHVQPEEFVAALIGLSNVEKKFVGYALKERYQFDEIASKLREEIDFLKALDSQISIEIGNRREKVSGHILQILRDGYLREAINKLEKLGKK